MADSDATIPATSPSLGQGPYPDDGRESKALRAELERTKRDLVAARQDLKRLQERQAGAAPELSQQFLTAISHDLRTPLSAILLWTSLIEDQKVAQPEELAQALTAIKESGEELSAMVEKLAHEARVLSGKLPSTNNDSSPAHSGRAGDGSSTGAPSLARCHVLLIEDVADTREELTSMLEKLGASVAAVDSAAAAWESMDRQTPDVILSDLTLPTIDAHDFIRALRENEATTTGTPIPAVALTDPNDEEMTREALQSGFQSSIPKPVNPVRLVTAITSLLVRKP